MGGLRQYARRLVYRHAGGTALVLIYHRVADLDRNPQALAVSTANFNAQMSLLAERHRVMPLDEMAYAVRGHRTPHQAVAVTFDDGYADNLTSAAPILVRHGIPATVYINSALVGRSREFWWDELEQLMLAPGTLPQRIEIGFGNQCASFDLGDFSTYTSDQAEEDAHWSVIQAPTNPRQRLYAELTARMKPLTLAQRNDVLGKLAELAGVRPEVRDINRSLTVEEVVRLDQLPGIRVGGHTRTHQVLSALGSAEQLAEIIEDRDSLVHMCGRPIDSFSYPFGTLDDYTDETVSIVRTAGYTHACSNHPGVVKPWTDPYRIPRNVVFDWDAKTFAAKLQGWFDEPR